MYAWAAQGRERRVGHTVYMPMSSVLNGSRTGVQRGSAALPTVSIFAESGANIKAVISRG